MKTMGKHYPKQNTTAKNCNDETSDAERYAPLPKTMPLRSVDFDRRSVPPPRSGRSALRRSAPRQKTLRSSKISHLLKIQSKGYDMCKSGRHDSAYLCI